MRDFRSIDSEYSWFMTCLNEHRVRLGISLDDLSSLTKIDSSNLSRIFHLKNVPSVKNLMKIMDALNLRISLKSGYLYPFI